MSFIGIIPIFFIAVLIILLVEVRLSSKWSYFYFSRGIQLYYKEVNSRSIVKDLDDFIGILNASFKGTGYSPSIKFTKIDNQTIGFREKMFEFSLFIYTPLMHGNILIDNTKIKIKGLANWYPIAFTCLWYSSILPTFRCEIDFMFLVVPIIIFGVIYFIQLKKYNKVFSKLSGIKQ